MYMDGTLQRYKCHKISFSTSVHITSLLYKCTQNQFTVQVYTKLFYWLIMKGMYKDRIGFVYPCTVNWFCVHFKQPNLGNIQFWGHTDTHTDRHTYICTSRAASSQLKSLNRCPSYSQQQDVVLSTEKVPKSNFGAKFPQNCI